jgi:peptidoglycan/LPS O-acetylase OafA/YrhL
MRLRAAITGCPAQRAYHGNGSRAVCSQTTFVPSLVLFVVVGGALALAAVMVFRVHRLARAIACAAAAVLLVWIVVQVAIIGYVSWMQPATFAAGLVMLLLVSLLPSTASTGGACRT